MMKARYRKKVDPVAVLAMWDVGMDTYAISSITGCLESDVYRVLARVMERRRHDQVDTRANCFPPGKLSADGA